MNPAALKVNVKNLKPNAIVLIDTDSFQKSDLDKAQFTTDDPFQELGLGGVQVVAAPISTMVKDGLAEFGLDNKSALRCKNMFALGLVCWLFDVRWMKRCTCCRTSSPKAGYRTGQYQGADRRLQLRTQYPCFSLHLPHRK